jgi:glutamate/tyrosine decarboxylase-like PLP-dependent enzyme
MTQPAARVHHSGLLAFADHVAARVDRGAVSAKVAPSAATEQVASRFDLEAGATPDAVLRQVEDLLRRFAVQVTHRRYFGLFNPSVLPESVAAAALVAAYNPQEAVFSHAPGAIAMERRALAFLAGRIGWDGFGSGGAEGHFTSGGQEANLSALVVALAHRFPAWREEGIAGLDAKPVFYVGAEGHHSLVKAARVVGLGERSVRRVAIDASGRMDLGALSAQIADDQRSGAHAFMVVGTAGTTSTGAIDALADLAVICREHALWLHCDAAWGGGALLSDALRGHLEGIDAADSVTWDAHKWLSTPMGAGAFLCRHPEALDRAFAVESGYMPAGGEGVPDPHRTSLQWSRRAIGVPVLAALATRGTKGYARLIEHQTQMGDALRARLEERGFRLVNETPLPLVCFTHPRADDPASIARSVVASGQAWISTVTLADGARALRACITSYRTTEADLDALVDALCEAIG